MLISARVLVLDGAHVLEGGGVLVSAGRIERVLRSRRAVLRAAVTARWLDLPDLVLTPGLIDAHAHLELTPLAGRLRGAPGFVPWIGSLLRARQRLRTQELEAGVRRGARRLVASGVTAVGDIDSTGTTWRIARGLGLRVVAYRELLDAWDPARTDAAIALARRSSGPSRSASLVQRGLAPHAPFTTSRALLREAGVLARGRALPVTIHWAETPEESAWLERGRGPLARLLPASPRCRGLALLAEAGLLGRRTALVHGNHPARGEVELLARSRATLVHCPGTHAFFRRPPFPLERYRRAGVVVALGTDSLASNAELDLRREMGLLRRAFPALAPGEVFDMATAHGARALHLSRCGRIRAGFDADLAAWRVESGGASAVLDELTASNGTAERVWVAGRVRRSPRTTDGAEA